MADTARALARLVRRHQLAPATVIASTDLHFLGPIADSLDASARLDWMQRFDPARFDPWYAEPEAPSEFKNGIDAFWTKIRAWQGPATVWYSSGSAQEWSGLVALLKFAPRAAEFDFINVHILPGKAQHRSTASLTHAEYIAALPYATRFSALEIREAHALYDRLAADPDPVRFVRGGALLAGPADVHDAEIESELESEFQTGEAVLTRMFAAQAREAWQADAAFYAFRLKTLAQQGAIDAKGDAYELETGEVRDLTPSADMLDENRLHVLGSFAALGLVKQYSIAAGKPIRHLIETRTLFPALGPLATLNTPDARLAWFRAAEADVHRHMGLDEAATDACAREWQDLWSRLDRWSGPVTIWMSRRSAADRSFLLALAKHCRQAVAFDFIDMADPDLADPPLPNVERASADQISAAARRAFRLSEADLSAARKEYDRLAAAPKGLRYLKADKLTEGPLDQFDKRILKIVTPSGRALARVIDDVLAEEADEGYDQADHYFWLWRFEELVLAGELEVEGRDYSDWRVKRARKPADATGDS